MSTIKGGVGYGQPNSPDDVRLIQQLLNQHIGKLNQQSRVAEDGRFGPNTARAIVEFQSKVLHHTKPDGVVGVAGPTFLALEKGTQLHKDPPNVTAFISRFLKDARAVKARWGVPVSVILAQSAQETGWGKKVIQNAYFGIKGKSESGNSAKFGTTEVINGKVVHIKAQFRAYKDYAESADDYGRYLTENKRYQGAFAFKNDPVKFVEAVARAGYATDPNYAKNLAGIIRSHRLDQYDR